jgi:hypothetical protein
VSTQAWIFLVGLRVLDLGALLGWLVWFVKLRHEPDDGEDPGSGGGGGPTARPPDRPVGPFDGVPLPDAGPWPVRLRDHGTPRRAASRPLRGVPARHRTPVRGR